MQSRVVGPELKKSVRACNGTERRLVPLGLDEESLDALAEKMAERLKSRSVQFPWFCQTRLG
jgi:hypothetical protein